MKDIPDEITMAPLANLGVNERKYEIPKMLYNICILIMLSSFLPVLANIKQMVNVTTNLAVTIRPIVVTTKFLLTAITTKLVVSGKHN